MTEEHKIESFRYPIWTPRDCEPHERLHVEQSLALIEARLRPASRDAIRERIARLMNVCGTEEKLGADAIEAKQNDYILHLAEFSEAHLDAAISEWVRREKWFPKISELRELADNRRSLAREMRRRARVLLGLEEAQSWETSMAERLKAQEERKRAEASVPNIDDRIAKLPPGLADQTRRLMSAAQNTPVEKRGNI